MAYKSLGDEFTMDIEQARADVFTAQRKYSAGQVSADAVNAANRKLADAHAAWRNYYGGRVPVREND